MNKRTKSVIQFVVLLGVGILLTWLSLRSVWSERDKIISSFQNADYFWVFVSTLISLFSHFLRAYRWNYLLKPAGYSVRPVNAMGAVLVGYFANYGLPRMGEITRCTLVTRYDKVPFEVALGTVITERIIDTLLLLVIFVITLFAQFSELSELAAEYIFIPLSGKLSSMAQKPMQLVVLVTVVVLIIVGFLLVRKRISRVLTGKFGNIIKGFGKGLSSVKDIEHKFQFIVLSVAIWASYFYSMYFILKAFDGTSHLGHSASLVLLLFGTFGVVFSPGGLGAYQAILTGLLISTYHVEMVPAVAMPWMSWTSQFILIVVLGILSLIVLPIIHKNRTADVVS
jgi:uncharacterized protein (TIRG00374 family)